MQARAIEGVGSLPVQCSKHKSNRVICGSDFVHIALQSLFGADYLTQIQYRPCYAKFS